MKRFFLKLALSGVTCCLALVPFYSIGKTNENIFSNTVSRANCSQEVAFPYLKKVIPVDPSVVSNVIDALEKLIETNCRRELMESWIKYPPKRNIEREVSTLSREELRSMIEEVLNEPIEYQKLVFEKWSERTMVEHTALTRLLRPISHAGGWNPRAFTDEENIAYYILSSQIKSVFYAELRDALLMRETVLTNAFFPTLIRAIEVPSESCNEKKSIEKASKTGTE